LSGSAAAGPARSLGQAPAAALVAQRCVAQLLSWPSAIEPVAIVRHLLAVQGQDPRGFRLAVRARSNGLSAADVDHALTEQRSLVVAWLNRGTLHLVTAEDYWLLHPLTTPQLLPASVRRLAMEGVSADQGDKAAAVIDAALTADGPLTRSELAQRLTDAGIPVAGQRLVHLLYRAAVAGLIVRGPMLGREHAFVSVRDWLGAPPASVDQDAALAELARRYLVGHGPAGERDLARWAGVPLRQARRGLSAISAELRDRDDGLAELRPRGGSPDGGRPPDLPAPRLLGPFDPLLHGWVDRSPVLGSHQGIVTTNGVFRPFALVAGRAAGTWGYAGGKVNLMPFGPLPERVAAALRADAEDVVRFFGADQS
jgi:hypothetical protein